MAVTTTTVKRVLLSTAQRRANMTGGGGDLPVNGINSHRNKLTAEPTILCFGKPKIKNSWRWQDFSLGISFAKLLKPNFCQSNFSKHLDMLLGRVSSAVAYHTG